MTDPKPENVSWQAWVFVTIVVAVISALPNLYEKYNNSQRNNTQVDKPPENTTPSPTKTNLRDHANDIAKDIEKYVDKYFDAVTTDYRTNNFDKLKEILDDNNRYEEAVKEELRKNYSEDIYYKYSYRNRRILPPEINDDGLNANVEVIQSRELSIHRFDGICLYYVPEQSTNITLYFIKRNNSWKVSNVKFNTEPSDKTFRC